MGGVIVALGVRVIGNESNDVVSGATRGTKVWEWEFLKRVRRRYHCETFQSSTQ